MPCDRRRRGNGITRGGKKTEGNGVRIGEGWRKIGRNYLEGQ